MEKHSSDGRSDSQSLRLFVGGIAKPITQASLSDYFARFGTVVDVLICLHPGTMQSKGFGFVTYADEEDACSVLQSASDHFIHGVRLHVKRAIPRKEAIAKPAESRVTCRKLFVDGLPHDVDKQRLREYFSMFGTVEELTIMHKIKKKKSLFAFILFEDGHDTRPLLEASTVVFEGRELIIRKALTKKELRLGHQADDAALLGPCHSSDEDGHNTNEILSKPAGRYTNQPQELSRTNKEKKNTTKRNKRTSGLPFEDKQPKFMKPEMKPLNPITTQPIVEDQTWSPFPSGHRKKGYGDFSNQLQLPGIPPGRAQNIHYNPHNYDKPYHSANLDYGRFQPPRRAYSGSDPNSYYGHGSDLTGQHRSYGMYHSEVNTTRINLDQPERFEYPQEPHSVPGYPYMQHLADRHRNFVPSMTPYHLHSYQQDPRQAPQHLLPLGPRQSFTNKNTGLTTMGSKFNSSDRRNETMSSHMLLKEASEQKLPLPITAGEHRPMQGPHSDLWDEDEVYD